MIGGCLPFWLVVISWPHFINFLKGLSGFHDMRAISHAPQFIVGKGHSLRGKDLTGIKLRPHLVRIGVSNLKYLALYFNFQSDRHESVHLRHLTF